MPPATKQSGFTLIETIIYIALFSIIFTGLFVSTYPILTGAERLTSNIAADSETAFVLAKINYALNQTIIDETGAVTTPAEGATADELVLSYGGSESFHFTLDTSGTFCSAPLVCEQLVMSKDGAAALPLTSARVRITDFSVIHVAPAGGAPRYLDITFTANNTLTNVRYYLRF